MIITVFILGLIVGSFLNAVIFRLATNESFATGRSHCPHCHHVLSALDLIPVLSFFILGGKCRYCGGKISWQYPLVELTTAVIFALLASNYGLQVMDHKFLFEAVLACFFIVIAVYDYKHYLILDKVVFPSLVLVIIWNMVTGNFFNGLFGGVVVSGFFAAQYFISKGRWIGFGDVKLGLVLGNLFGLPGSLVLLMLAYFSGALVGIFLLITKRKHLTSHLPFGVFLSLSAIIMMLYGSELTKWYLNIIGFR
jgi:leader peptidase (prepilin peptidase)/N-methyltransferase